MSKTPTTYDYIVVGAGAAGAVLAARLSRCADARVLVLEAGSASPPPLSSIPQGWPLLSTTEWNWGDSSTVQSATGRSVPVPRGRGVGGSSLINGMIFMRGHRTNFDVWANLASVVKRRLSAIPHCGEPTGRWWSHRQTRPTRY
ncbi:GMC family oxidoreductase N-terminal domain-containing protein [Mycobacterium sp. URHB0021]|jgi:choline dehydrogenase-like flavoprotein